mmetsp:Transcript_31412/g.73658  ORF Transcript_31412/g.73658 Transcript_31412/m.73658 type:complete len:200 (-) Transcript_31412:2054-2653(-)
MPRSRAIHILVIEGKGRVTSSDCCLCPTFENLIDLLRIHSQECGWPCATNVKGPETGPTRQLRIRAVPKKKPSGPCSACHGSPVQGRLAGIVLGINVHAHTHEHLDSSGTPSTAIHSCCCRNVQCRFPEAALEAGQINVRPTASQLRHDVTGITQALEVLVVPHARRLPQHWPKHSGRDLGSHLLLELCDAILSEFHQL